MPLDIETIFGSDKMLATAPTWQERDSEALEILCPLEIDGTVIEGLYFRMRARKRMPDELVTVQIEYHPANEPGGPLSRIEWRPMSSHNNRGLGPKEFRNRMIEGCHYHPFQLNLKHAPDQMRRGGRLPIAVPMVESPKNFDELLGFVKKEFRVTNIEWVEVPPWEPTLV
jgi:hypothetical protein